MQPKPAAAGFWRMPSTVIRNAHYDPEHRILSVWFRPSGKRYDYADVPPETYSAYRAAFSKGHFFNTRIRDHFRYREVAEGSEPRSPFLRP